jgi:hypothetical protein
VNIERLDYSHYLNFLDEKKGCMSDHKPLLAIKGPGPYIMAPHIESKFWSLPLGKTHNLYGAIPPEGPSN